MFHEFMSKERKRHAPSNNQEAERVEEKTAASDEHATTKSTTNQCNERCQLHLN